MAEQVTGYEGTFPTILRELLECHPKTGEKTTLKALGEYVGIRQQTISLYKNGTTQPTPENLIRIAEYFHVSVDYLLTGVSSENKALHEELGLSESAITLMKYAKNTEGFESTAPLIKLLDSLLSDKDFYAFLEELEFKSTQVRNVLNGKFDKSKMGNFNIEGYFIWDLQKFVEEFILKQLQKRGLQIEDSTVSEE